MADAPDFGPLMGGVPVQKSLGRVPKRGFPSPKRESPSVRAMKRSSGERPGAARLKRAGK